MDIISINEKEHICLDNISQNKLPHEVDNKKEDHKQEISKNTLDRAVKKINRFLEDDNVHAEYKFHEKFGDLMIKIVDDETKEVLMEIPPEKILDVVSKLCELSGIVFDKRV